MYLAEDAKVSLEKRIALHMNGIVTNFIGVGLCLNEAKENKVVPHGEWQSWVQAQTGFSPRQAQRLMQAAREVEPDSAVARLDFSKIQALLPLPEEQRESLAEVAREESLTLKELKAEVKKLQQEKMRDNENARDALEVKESLLYEEKRKSQNAKKEIKNLRDEITYLKNRKPAAEVDAAANERVKALEEELFAAEEYAKEQAAKRAMLEEELMQKEKAPELPQEEGISAVQLSRAVQGFISEVSCIPYMRFAHTDRQEEAALYLEQVSIIERWASASRSTLSVVEGEGDIW